MSAQENLVNKHTNQTKITGPNGSTYEGFFENDGLLYGIQNFKNGDIYEGRFEYRPEGISPTGYCTLTYSNSNIYRGYYRDEKLNGQGKLCFINGDSCEGHFENDEFLYGIKTLNNGDIHHGYFKDYLLNGQGKIIYDDGNIYEGEFKDDKLNGKGKIIHPDYDIFEGEFKDNKLNGYGKYISVYDDIYEGEFKDNVLIKN